MKQDGPIVGEFHLLKVTAVDKLGAYLQGKYDKDIFLPFAETNEEIKINDNVLVFVFKDKSLVPMASMKLENFLEAASVDYREGQEVDLCIYRKTDLGYKAIIDSKSVGVLYADSVYQDLTYGQKLKGFIDKIRSDGKIDLRLHQIGHNAADFIIPHIMQLLNKHNGFLNINEKTAPETIYQLFGVSKKKYKMVIGAMFKKRLITIHEDGIRLTKS